MIGVHTAAAPISLCCLKMLSVIILCLLPASVVGILSELHAVLRNNSLCSIAFNSEVFASLIASNTRTHSDLIDEYINIPIRYYNNGHYSSATNAYNKLKIVFHFMEHKESPLCRKLTSFGGFFHTILAGIPSEGDDDSSGYLEVAAKKIYFALVRESAFVIAVQDIFREPAMKQFVFPSEQALGPSWMQFKEMKNFTLNFEAELNFPKVLHFSNAFFNQIDRFIAFFIEFYQSIKPTDTDTFKTLLLLIGMHQFQTKLQTHLLFSKNPAAKMINSLYFSITSERTPEAKAEKAIEFLLRKEVVKQIVNFLEGYDSSEKIQELQFLDATQFFANDFICEVGIKSAILFNTLTGIILGQQQAGQNEEQNILASISLTHFVVALSDVEVYPKQVAKFIAEVFEVKEETNQIKIFLDIVNILKPNIASHEILVLEDVYKINHYKAALFMIFKTFDFSDTLETAKILLEKLEPAAEDENEVSLLDSNREIVDSLYEKCNDYEDSFLQTELCIDNSAQLRVILDSYIQKREQSRLSSNFF